LRGDQVGLLKRVRTIEKRHAIAGIEKDVN
jgi:hypothetical protein